MGKDAKRLFTEFQPEAYKLDIRPNKKAKTFTGTVSIRGRKTYRPNQRLTFHQKDLKITDAQIIKHDKKGDQTIVVDRINHHAAYAEVRLHASQTLYPGEYTVTMEFKGKITQAMSGIYPCFFEHRGQKKQLLATQFESHYAREAFPCIDEPEAKATFDLAIHAPKGEIVLANTPVRTQLDKDEQTVSIFETTPRMSTYLLAFVIGEMHGAEAKTKGGITVRSWGSVAVPKTHLQYSVDEGVRLLEFFTDYFGIPYPLEKCDQVALPDFDAGAMENWGLVTYREVALLADPVNRSVSNEQYISLVVAHELSHQWFGNLVTMRWWDDLWLNESFASLMEHLALDAIHPEWQQWEAYAAMDVVSTSSRDVYSDIQPVGVKVTDPDLIHTLFDPGIVYAKGGRLLKMLRDHIGDKAFVAGLKVYFTKHAYGNASRQDLWDALSQTSGQDISALLTPWIAHPGMPLLTVVQNGRKLHITQQRFLLDDAKDSFVWPIPLLADVPLAPSIIDRHENDVTAKKDGFALLNQHASGHYIVHYSQPAHRAYLAKSIETGKVPTEARINLLNDRYMLARLGVAPLTDGMDLTARLAHEPRENVWALMSRILNSAHQLTEGDMTSERYLRKLRCTLAYEWYAKLGWDDKPDDDTNTKQLRQVMISFMIAGEDTAAIETALSIYKKHKRLQDIPAEPRSTILVAAVRYGDQEKVIERLLGEYEHSSPELQHDISAALSSTRDAHYAKHILETALGEHGFVRAQDVLRWTALFVRNYHVRAVAWDFMVTNWKWLEATLENSKSFDFLPVYCAGAISTPDWEKKFHDLFDSKRSNKTLQRNIAVGTADIRARIAWRERDEALIAAWLYASDQT